MRAPNQPLAAQFQQARALHQAGRLDQAEPLYRAVLRTQKHHPDAGHLLAMLLHQKGDTAGALPSLDRLLKAHPTFAAAHNTRGLMLNALGRHAEAVAAFNNALAAMPAYAIAWLNRGHALAAAGNTIEALSSYDQAIAANPSYAEAHYGKAKLLQETGSPEQARLGYDRAITLQPNFPEALNNRAIIAEQLGDPAAALADYAHAVALRPGFAEAWNNNGAALDRLGRYSDALASFRRAVASRPAFKGALLNLADALYVGGRRQEALAMVARTLEVDPADMKARVFRLMFQLPILYDSEPEILERRAAYARELDDLFAFNSDDTRAGLAEALEVSQPFFLAYQGLLDLALQRTHGALVSRTVAACTPAPKLPAAPAAGERIRVGIVCGFFRQHPVWRIPVQGWVTQLDRARFEVFGYHTSAWRDAETEQAAATCDKFVQGPLTPSVWRSTITADAPHVLLYPEIGMDRMSTLLASQRLAPVQCNSLGHPDTSGLPTLDYFLSSEEMEPEDGASHYTERLIRLPDIGLHYEPRQVPTVAFGRDAMGVRLGIPVFWCGQSLYKYLPQYDDIYPRIARGVGDCQFTFIAYPYGTDVTDQFRRRLQRAFARFGLDAEAHCVILPRLDGAQFAAAISQVDVVLDSIGWAGFNTNLESLAHDKPIVTFAGPLMRSRHTAAVMRVMGLHDTIAGTVDDYVQKAVLLGTDPAHRAALSDRIAGAKHRVYRATAPIRALEDFLEHAVRTASKENILEVG